MQYCLCCVCRGGARQYGGDYDEAEAAFSGRGADSRGAHPADRQFVVLALGAWASDVHHIYVASRGT